MEQVSGRMEQPRFRLAYKKGFVGAGVGCVNIVCQMLHVALIGVLSVQGIILQGALTGGGNLCGNLSGGQKQRVAIARALLYDRSVLLVDEGTSALDQENADRIERNLLSRPELTLILVSHHLSQEQKKRFTQVFALPGGS